ARLLQFHRSAGRYAALAPLLAEAAARFGDDDVSEERRLLVAERVRLLGLALDAAGEAEALVRAELARTPNDEALLLWLARHQHQSGDLAGYAGSRQQQVRLLPPRLGALVLCHLAELAYEGGHVDDALASYRAARTLDPDNRFAAEGLKALGRRTRNWRATAALLPDDDAQALGLAERAKRLVERGAKLEAKDAAGALDLYERAIAIDPDVVAAWDALARVRQRLGDGAGSYAATRAALRALWRATPPDPRQLGDEARRFDALASLATAHEDAAAAGLYAERAHDIDRSLPSAALTVAGRARSDGRTDEAVSILSHVLAARTELTAAERVDANYRLGLLVAKSGDLDRALGHFRDGLRIEPLHAGLIHAVADVLTQKKRVAAAIQHYTQALLLAHEPRRRAQLYARLGTLWEETLKSADDAGACYDLAVVHGIDEPEVMLRALAYYRRTGRLEAAGRLIDRLLPRATTPTALAALWTERGSLLASTDDPRAAEAFDMALSYDPTCRAAVDGLAELLERRGEWQQLVDLLEARIDSGSADERAMCLRRLARIARHHQRDDASAEIYLRRAAALQPTTEDYDQLLEIVGDGGQRKVERETLQAERLALAGPFVPALTQAGIRLAAEDDRRWAWCVLSPLMMTIVQDSALKSLVLDLRKELEKADTLALLSPELHRRLLPANVAPPLVDVLAELDALLPFGPTSIEAIASGRGTRVDTKTGLGKTFAAIAERLGLPDAVLSRVEDLSVPWRVLDEERPHVVARADLFTPLAPGEIHALVALMLEQARPGARLLASLAPGEARRVLTALLAATGRDVGDGAEIAPIKERIAAAAGQERLDRWAAQLSAVDNLTDGVPEGLAEAARRVGLVAAGEVRAAAKLVTRLEEAQPKIPSTGTAEELEQFFAGGAAARRLLAFALSPGFGALLTG
ncbi:MAG TPA: hypothetical protein VF945_01020, partial [Polyangia bacterium]